MHNERFYLTTQDILDKDFKIDARGYRPQEVDKFLDMVIKDYTELTEENNRIKFEYRKLKDKIDSASIENGNTSNNLDLLRRISNLEKTVYGKYN